jgi:hypothetical protein
VPGSAQVVLAVDKHEVLDSQPFELDRRPDTGKPGTHDEDVVLLRNHG